MLETCSKIFPNQLTRVEVPLTTMLISEIHLYQYEKDVTLVETFDDSRTN
ncbi:hypothetical protein HanPSC8_Chr01g0011731 [Helianthus annuus]|nr:hypothetical protein HanPSC8_Chr01g0011731 [Helianthus annuus]